MQIWMTIPVLTWLATISWFDVKKREIPHSAWVIIPLACAMVYRLIMGDWQLVVLAVLVSLVSERSRLAKMTNLPFDGWSFWIPPLFLLAYWGIFANTVGTLGILGFWIAWELHCWGGADAVACIALVLLWPNIAFVIALLSVHLVAAIAATIYSLLREHRLHLHNLPGLPLLLATFLVYLIFSTQGILN
jgi:hypothetical protein